jgi:hypothetical protein
MNAKVSEATGHVLDWMVAKADNREVLSTICQKIYVADRSDGLSWLYGPSKWWAEGGPIIEQHQLCVGYRYQCDPDYCPINEAATSCWARTTSGGYLKYGPTPLVAAMRCFVASRLGDEVDVPEELL